MLGEILDTLSELVDVVDRGVSSILKSPSTVPKPRPPMERQLYVPAMGIKPKPLGAPSRTWTPRAIANSNTSRTSLKTSKRYIPKRIPFQRKPKASLTAKYPAGKPRTVANVTPSALQKQLQIFHAPPATLPKAPSPQNNITRIRAADIQFESGRCDILVVAVADLETCKEVFGGWSAQFNLTDVKWKDELEQKIVSAVHKLNRDTTSALHSSYAILSSYRALSRLMDKQLAFISRTQSGGDLFSGSTGPELRRLSVSVKAQSSILSGRVRKVQECLSALVHDIERTKERAATKALRRKIWHWFVRIFRALSLLISAGGTIFSLVSPMPPGIVGSLAVAAASTLAAAVAKLCEMVENKFSETTFDAVLRLLRSQIPESAKAAELSLTSFQACHRILQLELQVRSGGMGSWMGASEARKAHGPWKEAEQRLKSVNR